MSIKTIRLIFMMIVLLSTTKCYATTWYVRTDGGDTTECTGTTDAAYPGSGTGQACAFEHPSWALGAGYSSTNHTNGVMQAGDTLIIQGSFKIGYGMPNTSGCSSAYPYACTLMQPPSGSDADHKTKIYGYGYEACEPDDRSNPTNISELWGTDSVYHVLNIGSNTDVKCLEITDHSGCMFRAPNNVHGNIDNDEANGPIVCSENYASSPGEYGRNGIQITDNSANITMDNVIIHGMALRSIQADQLGYFYANKLSMISGVWGNWEDGNSTPSAYYDEHILVDPWIKYAGCGERYPEATPHNCGTQDHGVVSDGIGFNTEAGIWKIYGTYSGGCDISFNKHDGVDFLYSSGGSINVDKCIFQSNGGAAVKASMNTNYITNSDIISNCAWWKNNPLALGAPEAPGREGTACNLDDYCDSNENYDNCADCFIGGICRPSSQSAIVFIPGTNNKLYLYNNTISGNSNIFVDGTRYDGQCGSGNEIFSKNNIFYGGEAYNGGCIFLTDIYYQECSTGDPWVINESNNSCYNLRYNNECADETDIIGDPNLVGLIYATCSNANQADLETYKNNFYLTSSSTGLIDAADNTVSMWNTSTDLNSYDRGASWDIGALEYGSVPTNPPEEPEPTTLGNAYKNLILRNGVFK